MNRFIARLTDGSWGLCSQGQKSLKIRTLKAGRLEPWSETDSDEVLVEERHAISEVAKHLQEHDQDARFVNLAGKSFVKDPGEWTAALRELEARPPRHGPLDGESPETETARLVPRTSLRHFYRLLRKVSADKAHEAVLDAMIKNPTSLAGLVQESFDHVSRRYCNEKDALLSPASRKDRTASQLSADRLVNVVKEAGKLELPFPNGPEIVGYCGMEVAPLRTTGSKREDGLPARNSGAGGIDLLLVSEDGYPVVGEVKATRDTDVFLALVQVLTYAVELMAPRQYERLRRMDDRFRSGIHQADIVLLVEGADHKLCNKTKSLCETLRERTGFDLARRIAVFDASPLLEGQSLRLVWCVDFPSTEEEVAA